MNEEKAKKTRIGIWLDEHSDAISSFIAYGSLAVIFGSGFYMGSKRSSKSCKSGFLIDHVNKGVVKDTKNNGIMIYHKNGLSQLFELAPGETIP